MVAQLAANVYHPGNRLSGSGPTVAMVDGEATAVSFPISMDRVSVGAGFDAEAALTNIEFAVNPIDSDGVESNGALSITMPPAETFTSAGNTDLYFGRLVVDAAYGPISQPLPMWAHTEYCTAVDTTPTPDICTHWQDLSKRVNPSADPCTQLTLTAPATTTVADYWSGGGSYGAGTQVLFRPFDGAVNRGGGGWRLNYTGSDDSYQVLAPGLGASTVNNYHPYLQLQQGQASFGGYRGHDRIIYWREVQN